MHNGIGSFTTPKEIKMVLTKGITWKLNDFLNITLNTADLKWAFEIYYYPSKSIRSHIVNTNNGSLNKNF